MRMAVIGCGLIGTKRAAAAKDHKIEIVCDPDAGRRNLLAKKTGAIPVADWRDALSAGLDAVVIATPHDQLAGISLAAVESGHHVLVEKPAGLTAEAVRPVLEASKNHEVVVKVGYNHRFHPAIMRAKELVDQGIIGPVFFIRGRYGHGGRPGYDKEWRFEPEISGGGELIDQGSHLIDLSRWFLGDLELAFGATPSFFWRPKVEDICFVALKSASEGIAWLHASWTEWKNLFSFEIMGKTGKLSVEGLGGSYGVERLTLHHMLPEMGPPETTIWEYPFPDNSFNIEFENFVAAVEGTSPPIGDIEDAVANLEIVGSVYESVRS